MTPGTKPKIPRSVAIFLPPVLALAFAVIYQQRQADQVRRSAEALCAQFKPGDAIKDFALAALEAEFKLLGEGADSLEMIAAKEIYRFDHESYRCSARHDGTTILSTETSVERLD